MPENAPTFLDVYKETMAAAGALMLGAGIGLMMRDPGIVPGIIAGCGYGLSSRHVEWRQPKDTTPEQ